jgi:NAD(P)-dependent dehydrogenase (short-subunit alcohol dehydrogenase family)
MSDHLRILLVGASGMLGKAVAAELSPRHEIISAGSKTGDIRIDIADPASIEAGFKAAGPLDAVACTAGTFNFLPLSEFKPAPIAQSQYGLGLANKLMGQVNLALSARDHLKDGGSITLTSGVLGDAPIAAGSSGSMVGGALAGFVMGAAIEMPRGIRINLVSPNVFAEAMDAYGPFFRGFDPVPVARAARGFSRSIEGLETGKTYRLY